MKKVYMTPVVNVVNVTLTSLLMASGDVEGGNVYETEASYEEEVLSRKGNFIWDDDDEY